MKKLIITLLMSGVMILPVTSVQAGGHGNGSYGRGYAHGYSNNHYGRNDHYRHSDGDWGTAGAVIAGILTVGLIADAFSNPQPVYSAPVYTAPAVVYYPATQRWIAGHYETVQQQVWIAGGTAKVWVEPVYEKRLNSGNWINVLVRDGYYTYQELPGHNEIRNVQRWVEGYWASC
jgi:hypothetical protein